MDFLFYIFKNTQLVYSILDFFSINHSIIGTIPDWISLFCSVISGILIPFFIYYLGQKQQKLRELEIKQNESNNIKLLSVDRCAKLHSKPMIINSSKIIFNARNSIPDISKILERDCVISNIVEVDNYLSIRYLKLILPFNESSTIDISSFLLDKFDIHFSDNSDCLIDSFFYDKNLDNKYKEVFFNSENSILTIYIVDTKENYDKLLKCIESCSKARIVLKINFINSFNIVTSGTWNATLKKEQFNEIQNNSTFIVEKSLHQIEKIYDNNINENFIIR